MLFRQAPLDGILAGTITLAFRRWIRPTVRSGGTLLTPVGQLQIGTVTKVSEATITADEAGQAGYASRQELLDELNRRPGGDIYRIELGNLRADPRRALREALPNEAETQALLLSLRRLDSRAPDGAWTARTLEVIALHPGVRAGTICRKIGLEKEPFKVNVRKLKRLGLTESLETGYRLSPRGELIRALWPTGT